MTLGLYELGFEFEKKTVNLITLADCAASPALFYADKIQPFPDHPRLGGYFGRLRERPAFARVVREAEPYMKYFPG